jgi:hypothetical protein
MSGDFVSYSAIAPICRTTALLYRRDAGPLHPCNRRTTLLIPLFYPIYLQIKRKQYSGAKPTILVVAYQSFVDLFVAMFELAINFTLSGGKFDTIHFLTNLKVNADRYFSG